MTGRSLWGVTPRQSIESACREHGRDHVVDACVALLSGGDAEAGLVRALGGPRAARFLDAGESQRYWLRVWGARGLLWAWEDRAAPAVVGGLGDEAWRVREMAAKVVARHEVESALEAVTALQHDANARVRAAASRALQGLTKGSERGA